MPIILARTVILGYKTKLNQFFVYENDKQNVYIIIKTKRKESAL